PFEYQNGAQWDWFGGRLIYTMYENGYSARATEKLLQIIHKNIANRGFFEWDNREGVGLGSDSFCGSAGVLAKAVIEGYFGIQLEKGGVRLEPRLGDDSSRIHIYQPATDAFLAYDHQYEPENQRITLRLNSNLRGTLWLRILIPSPVREKTLAVLVDGRTMQAKVISENQDTLVTLSTPIGRRTIVIQ
ncbi:MAG: hypothetical protein WBB73_11800, partial [Candidatus Aminicenantaceae bacterium]